MELKNQVCSLDLAKKLNKLGVKQESIWYHDEKGRTKESRIILKAQKDWLKNCFNKIVWEDIVSAFTVAELGELLPERVIFENYQKRHEGAWRISFGGVEFCRDNEANTKALMIVYLLENNLITLDS